MKPKNNAVNTLGAALLLAAVVIAPAPVSADLVVDRGLPTANYNATGSERSNISWGGYSDTAGDFWFTGDTFSVPTGPQCLWTIDTIRIWSPATLVGSELGAFYNTITLYGGTYQEHPSRTTPLDALSTGGITVNTGGSTVSDNANIQFTRVTYADGSNYKGNDGNDYQLWQVDFTNLNWVVNAGDLLEFGVDAYGLNTPFWYNHASPGPVERQFNGMFSQIRSDGLVVYDCNSGISADEDFCGWNKSSDINVQVFATPVPGALPLAVIGLFGLTAMRRTRAKTGVTMPPAC